MLNINILICSKAEIKSEKANKSESRFCGNVLGMHLFILALRKQKIKIFVSSHLIVQSLYCFLIFFFKSCKKTYAYEICVL